MKFSGKTKRNLTFKVERKDGETWYVVKDGNHAVTVPPSLVEQTNAEVYEWYSYLNLGLGTASFTFALGVQGTPNPPLNAALSLAFVLLGHVITKSKFPPHLKALKEKNPAYLSKDIELTRFLAKNIMRLQLTTFTTVLKAPLFYFGYLYLLFLALMNYEPLQKQKLFFDKPLYEYIVPPKDAPARCIGADIEKGPEQ